MDSHGNPIAPNRIYESSYNNKSETIMMETKHHMQVDVFPDKKHKIIYDKGVYVYIKGAKFPKKGFPSPEAIWGGNQAKKLLLEGTKIFKSPWFILGFLVMWKKLIKTYNEIALKAVAPYILKDNYLSSIAKEFKYTLYNFLAVSGIEHEDALNFAKILSFIIDIDDAYRFRLGDICGEIHKDELLAYPAKEIKRLLAINQSRESQGVGFKIKVIGQVIQFLMWIPKYKKAFQYAVQNCDISKMILDASDTYWVLFKPNYNYFGMSYEERQKLLDTYGARPPVYTVNPDGSSKLVQ